MESVLVVRGVAAAKCKDLVAACPVGKSHNLNNVGVIASFHAQTNGGSRNLHPRTAAKKT